MKNLFKTSLLATVLLAAPVTAHHSFADYYDKRGITLAGTLKEIRFTNPHIHLVIDVPAKNGAVESWEFSGPSPADWRSAGWVRSDFVLGSPITITGFPKRDGSNHLSIAILKTKDKSWGRGYK